jgi:hypothetical protein
MVEIKIELCMQCSVDASLIPHDKTNEMRGLDATKKNGKELAPTCQYHW